MRLLVSKSANASSFYVQKDIKKVGKVSISGHSISLGN